MFISVLNALAEQAETCHHVKHPENDAEYITLSAEIKPCVKFAPVVDNNCFYWSKPALHHTLIGYGSLLDIRAQGSDRFTRLKNSYAKLLQKWSGEEKPLAFIVFAFDAEDSMSGSWDRLPNSLLTIPEFIIEEKAGIQRLILNLHINHSDIDKLLKKIAATLYRMVQDTPREHSQSSGSEYISALLSLSATDKDRWQSLTQKAIDTIKSGAMEKLVTSRQLTFETENAINIADLLVQLISFYPTCNIFGYQTQQQAVVAASPECLISQNKQNIRSDAIGGTINQSSPDTLLGTSMGDNKILNEHAIIADDIYRRLAPYCHVLKMPVNPLLMKLHTMYHLETPISGQLHEAMNIFDLIELLHPTPAIAGYPAGSAKQWLLENECYNRGWYTGAFGWIQGTDTGELSVFIRCALIQDRLIQLFAGAGLVADSVAEDEWQETELKMHSILDLL